MDIQKIIAKKKSEDDGGVSMGSSSTRMVLGNNGVSMMVGKPGSDVLSGIFSLDPEAAIIKSSKIHLSADLDSIFLSGGYSLNPELMTCIPSTMVTPIPVLKMTPFSAFKSLITKAKRVGAMFG